MGPTGRPQHAEPVLSVRALRVGFGPLRVLDGTDLDLHAGEIVALVGENGAGKSTLVRCVAGDLPAASGTIELCGEPLVSNPGAVARRGVAVVWQDLALCDNLDVASNLLLGDEKRFLLRSDARRHARAAALLERLKVNLDTSASVRLLSGGQRQLLAVARAMRATPRVLLLDEPTAALGVAEATEVERLITAVAAQGSAVLLVSHDLPLVFRLARRIVVMRAGRVHAEVDPARAYPDDVIALMSGAEVAASPRHQLSRLHALADRLASSDRSSSLPLILSTLGAALGEDRLVIHRRQGRELSLAASLGLPGALARAWQRVPTGARGGPVGLAVERNEPVIDENVASSSAWHPYAAVARATGVEGSWAVPVTGGGEAAGVITVLRSAPGRPARDELELLTLYGGYVASALERERLFAQLTSRNRVLETIREVLEILAGPVPVADGLHLALQALFIGLGARGVVLLAEDRAKRRFVRAETPGSVPGAPGPGTLLQARAAALLDEVGDHVLQRGAAANGGVLLASRVGVPDGRAVLVAHLDDALVPETAGALVSDAAHCLQLALEREQIGLVQQEAAALRRSRQLQRDFLSRLSHELRTPLTAIQGYADSLRQDDVTFSPEQVDRFLARMASESARLGRLVEDLLDYSALEAGVLRLQRDWCELPLVLDAARACLPAAAADQVHVAADDLPAIFADHDRLEQVLVNLLDNALRHNPPGTRVEVRASAAGPRVRLVVADDGTGLPPAIAAAPFDASRRPAGASAGTGLGLSIAAAIVQAHGGTIALDAAIVGTRFVIELPVEAAAAQREPVDA